MPIFLSDPRETPILPEIGQLPPVATLEDLPEGEEPTTLETLGAAFRLENTVASGVASMTDGVRRDDEIDPDFDFIATIPERHQNQPEHYAFVNNQAQADAVTRKIDREIQDREIIAEAGTLGIVSMFAAAMIDPVNFIPVGGTAYKTYRVGGSILKGATTTAKAGLLSSTAAEALLQHTQTQRTLGEGAVNITASTFLSGVLGGSFGAFRALSKKGRLGRAQEFADDVAAGADPGRRDGASDLKATVKTTEDTTSSAIDKDMEVPPPDEADLVMPYQIEQTAEQLASDTGSVGAAAARPTTIAEETIKSALGMEKVVKFQDPLLRTATAPSIQTRQISQRLSEQILTYEKNALGIETPIAVETRIAQHQVGLYKSIANLDNEFIKYRKGREKRLLDIPQIGLSDIGGAARRAEKLTYHGFKIEVSNAMRNGDNHPIPEVAAAAKKFRSEVFDPLKDDAISLGLLADDVEVETAPSYLMRVYNIEKIIAERPEFQRRVLKWLGQQRALQAQRAEQFPAEAEKFRKDIRESRREVRAIEKAVTKATVEEITKAAQVAAKKALADIDLKLPAPKAKPGQKQIEAKALKSARAKQLKVLQKEIEEAIKEESELVLIEAADEALASLRKILDEEDIADISALLREQIPPPVAKAGEEVSIATVKRFEKLFKSTALEEANKTFQRSVSRQLKRLETLKPLDDADLAAKSRTKLEREIKAEITKEAKKAANAAAREATKIIREDLNEVLKAFSARKKLQRKDVFKSEFEDLELDDIADQIIDRILGTPDGRLPYDINPNVSGGGAGKAALGGALKRRSFLIPDSEIEDFLESDIEHIARIYTRSMSSDVELVREFDDVNMTTQIDDIRRDYSQKAKVKGLTQKELKKLNSRKDDDIRDIAAMRDRIRGTYAMPADPTSIIVRGARVVRSLNYLRLLGGMTISAFPDTMRAVMVHGLGRVIGDGIVPMIKNFRATRLAAEEVKLSGTALDMILDSRTMQIADLMDDFGRHSKFERGIKAAQDKFGIVSLMAPWNAFMKQWTGMITMSRMLKGMQGIADGTRGSKKELEKLASMGINPEQAKRIAGFFKEHGQIQDGVYLPNTEAWTGPGAQQAVTAFRSALKKQVDIIIVTPGQDKPLWMSTELGKMIGQFKSFAVASVQRTMLTGLQQRDLAALNGALLSVGAGMAVYYMKQTDAGREVSNDPSVWITEGLDRSGLFGWFFDVNNIIEKATRGRVGMNALTGGPQMSRYASRNITGALLGPTFGFTQDLTTVIGDASQGDWTESDTRALRRLLPYQNLMGFRRVLDMGETGINEVLGVQVKKR